MRREESAAGAEALTVPLAGGHHVIRQSMPALGAHAADRSSAAATELHVSAEQSLRSGIVGGEEVRHDVGLLARLLARVDGTYRYVCDGAVVARRAVVTTAACLAWEPSFVEVGTDSTWRVDVERGERRPIPIIGAQRHPQAGETAAGLQGPRPFDVAVVLLGKDIAERDLSDRARVADKQFVGLLAHGDRLLALGFGATDHDIAHRTSRAHVVDIPLADSELCRRRCEESHLNCEAVVCAGGEEGRGVCVGDWGSPLLYEIGAGEYALVGVSTGFPGNVSDCGRGGPTFFTSIPTVLGWMESVVGQANLLVVSTPGTGTLQHGGVTSAGVDEPESDAAAHVDHSNSSDQHIAEKQHEKHNDTKLHHAPNKIVEELEPSQDKKHETQQEKHNESKTHHISKTAVDELGPFDLGPKEPDSETPSASGETVRTQETPSEEKDDNEDDDDDDDEDGD